MALVHLDAENPSERVIDAIRATPSDTEKDLRELQDSDPGRNIQRYGGLRATSTRRSRPRQLFLESGVDHLAVYLRNVITGCSFAVRVIP